MPSYPGSIKIFTTKTNKVDLVDAAHINDLQGEVTAIETELGTDPAGSVTDVKTRLYVCIDNDGALRKGISFPGSPIEGQCFYRTDEDVFYIYDGTTWDAINVGGIPSSMQAFTTSGTWTKPAGVSKVYVKVWGGGGSGASGASASVGGGGGGGGGYAEGLIAVSGNVTVTVGGVAGTSSFVGNTTIQATGGSSGSGKDGGAGGSGSGGTVNLTGGSGGSSGVGGGATPEGSTGGGSPLGGAGGSGGWTISGPNASAGTAGTTPGGGGGGGGAYASGGASGGTGANGLVIVYW